MHRLESIVWEYLRDYSGMNAAKIDWLDLPSTLLQLENIVRKIPKQLNLSSLSSRMTCGAIENPKIANVTRWAWEPVGAAWPLKHLKQLDSDLEEAKKIREDLIGVDPEMAKLVARLYEFERRYRNRNYAGAVNVLSNLLNHFTELRSLEGKGDA